MEKIDTGNLNEQELKGLEVRVNDLIKTCEELKKENHLLKLQQDSYSAERASLIEKNEQARKKVEAIIRKSKFSDVKEANEFLANKTALERSSKSFNSRIRTLQNRIDDALKNSQQLEL